MKADEEGSVDDGGERKDQMVRRELFEAFSKGLTYGISANPNFEAQNQLRRYGEIGDEILMKSTTADLSVFINCSFTYEERYSKFNSIPRRDR